jgi:hypothetical protein
MELSMKRMFNIFSLGLILALIITTVAVQPIPAYALTWINKTTANGLGSNSVHGVFVSGSTVYAATDNGLSISTDGGVSFTNRTTTNGLIHNKVYNVFAVGSTVYAAVVGSGLLVGGAYDGGLSISTDGGATFTNRTTKYGMSSPMAQQFMPQHLVACPSPPMAARPSPTRPWQMGWQPIR